jgi:hypothetical protein
MERNLQEITNQKQFKEKLVEIAAFMQRLQKSLGAQIVVLKVENGEAAKPEKMEGTMGPEG